MVIQLGGRLPVATDFGIVPRSCALMKFQSLYTILLKFQRTTRGSWQEIMISGPTTYGRWRISSWRRERESRNKTRKSSRHSISFINRVSSIVIKKRLSPTSNIKWRSSTYIIRVRWINNNSHNNFNSSFTRMFIFPKTLGVISRFKVISRFSSSLLSLMLLRSIRMRL